MLDFSIAGLAVGLAVGLTGVGGGSMMTPMLIFWLGLPPAAAVGTDLLFATVTKAFGVVLHRRHDTVAWPVVRRLATGSVPAALGTVLALRHLATGNGPPQDLITGVLSVALVATGLGILLRSGLAGRPGRAPGWLERLRRPERAVPVTVAFGVLLGVLVTLSSVGAGAIGTAFLVWLYPDLTTAEVVGTDVAHAVLLALVAGLGHASLGNVEPAVLAALLAGSLPGMYLGTRLGRGMPDRLLRPALAGVLMLVGIGIFMQG
ncbi:MAG TPA: sulfite exporter TauE/SafE family protein [Gammaproteobacteria bacterium]|nr:sulfite exporter TauE/SafE family protein [Gammaproteobacteria bacterium]